MLCLKFTHSKQQPHLPWDSEVIKHCVHDISYIDNIDGWEQDRRNSIANALELRLSCPNP